MSTKTKRPNTTGQVSPGVLHAVRALTAAAMAASAYLAYVSLSGGGAAGCGPDSGCDKVLQSRWAYWFNVPVSVFALMVYSLILGASFRLGARNDPSVQRKAWAWMLACALVVLGSATWFMGVMLFSIKEICPYCLVSHLCGATAGVLILIKAPLRHPSAKPWELEKLIFVAPRTIRRVAIIAVTALTLLVAGQMKYQRPMTVVRRADAGTNPAPASQAITSTVAAPTAVPTNPPPPPVVAPPPVATPSAASGQRFFPVYNGQFQVDVLAAPAIGSPTNRHVVISLFDYTCHHCRAMHPLLVEAQQTFSNDLVIISLPMPLDPNCNPTVTRPIPSHTNACDYAKIGLAVWRADRAKHHEFDDWLMAGEKAPPIAEVHQKAMQLVGADAFNKALNDPWVEQQLKLSVSIYERAYREGQGRMPQLIVGSSVALGSYTKPELIKLLADTLGLKAPQPGQ